MSRSLRSIIGEEGIRVAGGAFECIGAKAVELAGLDVVYVTGAGVAASHLGRPDVGLTTLTEMVNIVRNIADSVELPIIVDADTGYGDVLNVRRAVIELEVAGASAIQIEDQVFPKRCGHFDGKEVVSRGEMVAKLIGACEARQDPETMIVARTDAVAVTGFDDAMVRGRGYQDAGADMLFIEAPLTGDEIRRIPDMFDIPVMFNMAASKKTPSVTVEVLGRYGYALASFAGVGIWAVAKTLCDLMSRLDKTGDIEAIRDTMMPWAEFWEMMDIKGIREAEAKYAV